MANVLISEDTMTDIADAIRSKKGVSTTYLPSEMPSAIESISGGGITPTGTIQITQNGTVDVTNYASANVAVPSVTPTGTKSITANGTYDVTNFASAEVNVSGGGSNSEINFSQIKFPSSRTWSLDLIPKNLLSNGGYIEFEFADSAPINDFGNVIGVGAYNQLSQWSTNTAINVYLSYGSGSTGYNVGIRQSSTTTYPQDGVLLGESIKIKIDKNYIYVNDVALVATSANLVNVADLAIGSVQGTKRFAGTFNYLKVVEGV